MPIGAAMTGAIELSCNGDDQLALRLQDRLLHDLEVARIAELTCHYSDIIAANALHKYLQRRYCDVLRMIDDLPEPEADRVEPLFTKFECILLRLELQATNSGLMGD
jgi:hypothetical protein